MLCFFSHTNKNKKITLNDDQIEQMNFKANDAFPQKNNVRNKFTKWLAISSTLFLVVSEVKGETITTMLFNRKKIPTFSKKFLPIRLKKTDKKPKKLRPNHIISLFQQAMLVNMSEFGINRFFPQKVELKKNIENLKPEDINFYNNESHRKILENSVEAIRNKFNTDENKDVYFTIQNVGNTEEFKQFVDAMQKENKLNNKVEQDLNKPYKNIAKEKKESVKALSRDDIYRKIDWHLREVFNLTPMAENMWNLYAEEIEKRIIPYYCKKVYEWNFMEKSEEFMKIIKESARMSLEHLEKTIAEKDNITENDKMAFLINKRAKSFYEWKKEKKFIFDMRHKEVIDEIEKTMFQKKIDRNYCDKDFYDFAARNPYLADELNKKANKMENIAKKIMNIAQNKSKESFYESSSNKEKFQDKIKNNPKERNIEKLAYLAIIDEILPYICEKIYNYNDLKNEGDVRYKFIGILWNSIEYISQVTKIDMSRLTDGITYKVAQAVIYGLIFAKRQNFSDNHAYIFFGYKHNNIFHVFSEEMTDSNTIQFLIDQLLECIFYDEYLDLEDFFTRINEIK